MSPLTRAQVDGITNLLGDVCRDYPLDDVYMHVMADFCQALGEFGRETAGMPEFDEYILAASRVARDNPQYRLGQAYFNCLSDMRPDISEKIRGGSYDPFYSDHRLPEFLMFVHSHWYDDEE